VFSLQVEIHILQQQDAWPYCPNLLIHGISSALIQQVPPLHRGRPHQARCAESGGGAAEAGGEEVRRSCGSHVVGSLAELGHACSQLPAACWQTLPTGGLFCWQLQQRRRLLAATTLHARRVLVGLIPVPAAQWRWLGQPMADVISSPAPGRQLWCCSGVPQLDACGVNTSTAHGVLEIVCQHLQLRILLHICSW
jgi:hypothetical protein